MSMVEVKSERIEVWITPSMKALLQRAATASHESVAEFLLETGMSAAEDTLMNRRLFRINDEQWQAFQEVLDRPVRGKPHLARLMAGKSVLDLADEGEGT